MTFASVLRDHTLDLLTKGYGFADDLRSRSDDPRAGSRVPMRLLGGDAVLVRGQDVADPLYHTDQVQREGAMPSFVGGGLFGAGSLHSMDGAAHLNRKEIFIRAALDRGAVDVLLEDARREWGETIQERWLSGSSSSVYDAASEVYGRSLLRWAGVETDSDTATKIARDEATIVDGFAVLGPAWVRTQVKRRQCDAWLTERIREPRAGTRQVRPGRALDLVLAHRELDGQPLSDHLAAAELQNVIRPAIAVCRFAAFLALAMHEHPDWRERISDEVLERGTTSAGRSPPPSPRRSAATTPSCHCCPPWPSTTCSSTAPRSGRATGCSSTSTAPTTTSATGTPRDLRPAALPRHRQGLRRLLRPAGRWHGRVRPPVPR